jgi:hypothetical protein
MNLDNNLMDFISSITHNFVQLNNTNGQRDRQNANYNNNNYAHYQPEQAQHQEEDLYSNESHEYEEVDEDENYEEEVRQREILEKRKTRIEELNLFQYKNIDKFSKRKDE